jgi:fatty-acyl-CoA synthase
MATMAQRLLARADDDAPAILFGEQSWSFGELVAEGWRRAAVYRDLHDPERPPHIGVLLDNGPEYLFWLAGAALSGAVVVGINSTYRGAPLRQLVEHTDCQVLVTSAAHEELLEGVDAPVPDSHRLVVDRPDHAARLDAASATAGGPPATVTSGRAVTEEDLLLLLFTSGSTGLPKAVRCTQGRLARTGAHVAGVADLGPDDVVYSPLPFFHSSSLFTGWSSTVHAGVPIGTRPRFSASSTLVDVRRFRATVLTYTGKVLNYILAVPERPDDATSTLRLAIGNEASASDIRAFARRFGCAVRDSYGATEGIIIIRRDPSMPEGALGRAADTVKVLDPETGAECPPARFDADGRVTNLEEAVGEIVETAPANGFEGYYRNDEATSTRFRGGAYWSGDLAFRDADGWFWFAGRSNEWLRVDGENFAAAPVEAIIGRHGDVRSVAVYAVPDDPVGDRVMVALELRDGAPFDPVAFDAFLAGQRDLGPKWLPSFVRVLPEIPKLASTKIDKQALRRDAWRGDAVYWRPRRGEPLRPLTTEDRRSLDRLLP